MGRIRKLDAHVVNQIAAGEVVDRPASVVKELVENALDAGAKRIRVHVEEGGRRVIEVADDGHGMAADDLELALHPHATSKVLGVADLEHIGTLGFRGEALASIGSVAHVTITSREAESEAAFTIQDDMGRLGSVGPAGGSVGTVVRVENLFGHLPARRKFLRKAGTELGHIRDLISRFALAFPHVGFRLDSGTRTVIECAASKTRLERIAALHGADLADALIPIESRDDEPEIEAYIGGPNTTRRDGRLEQVFLNGRHLRDRTVSHAIREAYRDLLPPGGQRPIVFLFLTLNPELVDVNVHPAKAEVRWRDSSAVHRAVRRTLRRALEALDPGVHVALGTAPTTGPGPALESAVGFAFERAAGRPAWAPAGGAHAHLPRTMTPGSTPPTAGGAMPPATHVHETPDAPQTVGGLRPIAQTLGTYLVLEAEDSLVLVDQHALHERVLFDQINDRLRAQGNLEVQRLLVPTVVHLGAAAQAELLEAGDLLKRLGWSIEAFGEDAVAVNGVPAVLRRPDPEGALDDILQVLRRGQAQGLDRTDLLSQTVDSMACRGAVMAGDVLHADEILALLAQAEALNHSHSCPHGRPTRLTLTKADLERWFHRTV